MTEEKIRNKIGVNIYEEEFDVVEAKIETDCTGSNIRKYFGLPATGRPIGLKTILGGMTEENREEFRIKQKELLYSFLPGGKVKEQVKSKVL